MDSGSESKRSLVKITPQDKHYPGAFIYSVYRVKRELNTGGGQILEYAASRVLDVYPFSQKKQFIQYFVIGSMAPDFIYFIMFFYLLIKNLLLHLFGLSNAAFSLRHAVHGLFDEPVTIVLRQAGHSLFIWVLAFAAIAAISRKMWVNAWLAFSYGWLGHILVDLLTHVQDAVPLFYPVSDIIFRGPVSYYDRHFFGREFSIINSVLIVLAFLYLILEKARKKRRAKKNSYTAGQ